MYKFGIIIVMIASAAYAQTAAPKKPAATGSKTPATQSSSTSLHKTDTTKPATATGPATPVITLHGLCPEKPAGTDPNSPDCKTVITRADFEKLVETLNPKMPANGKQSLAGDYARMLILANEAKKRGVENSPHYHALLQFVRLQVLAQELFRQMQQESKPAPADVEKYYKDNEPKYQEISLKRLFIPRNKPGAKAEDKKPTDEELQAQGEKFRAELEKGADFDKLQKEVYDSQGFTVPPPPTAIPNWRRDSVPPTQLQIFDLKPGQLSKVIVEPAGAYVYRLETKTLIPLDGVKAEIENNLATDRLRAKMDSLTSSIKPEVNKEYFLSLAPESPSGSIPGPGQHMVGPATEATPQPKP